MDKTKRKQVEKKVGDLLAMGLLESAKVKTKLSIEIAKFGRAQDYLVDQAYESDQDPILQKKFNDILPQNAILKERLSQFNKSFKSADAKIRISAAEQIHRAARATVASEHLIWLRHPDTIELVFSVLKREKNELVLVPLIYALGSIQGRSFNHSGIGQALLPFLGFQNSKVVTSAVLSLGGIVLDDKWPEIVALAKDLKNTGMLDAILMNLPEAPIAIRVELMEALYQYSRQPKIPKYAKENAVTGICELANIKARKPSKKLTELCEDKSFCRMARRICNHDGFDVALKSIAGA